MGKKGITGKYTVTKEDYDTLTSLAKEGISSRGKIRELKDENKRLCDMMIASYDSRHIRLRKGVL